MFAGLSNAVDTKLSDLIETVEVSEVLKKHQYRRLNPPPPIKTSTHLSIDPNSNQLSTFIFQLNQSCRNFTLIIGCMIIL